MKTAMIALLAWALLCMLTLGLARAQEDDGAIQLSYLMGHQDEFHGATITVSGWVYLDFEGVCVSERAPDGTRPDPQEAVWLDFGAEVSESLAEMRPHGRMCTLRGVYDMEQTGHFGMYQGTLHVEAMACDEAQ